MSWMSLGQRFSDKDEVERLLPMRGAIILATGLVGIGLSGDHCCCSEEPSSEIVAVGEVKPGVLKLCCDGDRTEEDDERDRVTYGRTIFLSSCTGEEGNEPDQGLSPSGVVGRGTTVGDM